MLMKTSESISEPNKYIQHVRLTSEYSHGGISISSAAITTLAESNPTSTTSSTTALAANANRKGGYLVNDSDTDIHVSWGGTATTSRQKVRANGGSINFIISGMVYTGAVNTIHAGSGSKTLYCVEIT